VSKFMPRAQPEAATAPRTRFTGVLFYVGAAGLLSAMLADAVAVVGRHVGKPLLGSIELVQASILIASSAAILSATVADKHAVVHLLIDRLPPRVSAVMARINAVLCAAFFAALALGSGWIASDMRGSHEVSEILGIPFGPLRVVSILAVAGAACVYGGRVVRRAAR
jgi:TRAP-type transport system small permease protein